MSPSDQDVSTTPAMRRCNSSRSPFVSGSLHFYGSKCTEVPRSLHFYGSGALTGQKSPQGGTISMQSVKEVLRISEVP